MPETFDAIVIGGGPAGSVAARHLARRGWHTLLVERGLRHRDKACGDCLSPRGARLLAGAGLLDEVRATAVGSTRRVRVHQEGRAPLTLPLPEDPLSGPGLVVDRSVFDQLLVDHAAASGVVVAQPATARIVHLDRHGATVDVRAADSLGRCRAGLLVGADGLRSAVARAAGLAGGTPGMPGGITGRKYGFGFDTTGPISGVAAATIEMFVMPGGYLGAVRREGGTAHVAGLVRAGVDPVEFVRSVAARFGLRPCAGGQPSPAPAARLLGAGPIPCRPRCVAHGPVVLVGDAAGYVEPFSGEGMSWALAAAAALDGVAANAAPGRWEPGHAACYRRMWSGAVGRRQRACRLLSWLLERPRATAAAVEMARRVRPVGGWMVREAVLV